MKKPNKLKEILAGKLTRQQLLAPNVANTFIDQFGKKWIRIPGIAGTEFHIPSNGRDQPENIA